MEFSISGNALKTYSRCITCLSRIANELVIQPTHSQLALHTLNSSRSAYQYITFKPDFFDVYTISDNQVQCSVLLKAICSVLRTPLTSIDCLNVLLPDSDASKVQWTLTCYNGMKKTYSITCNVEPEIQQLALDRSKLPSNFVVRPRDLNRLLGNFQSTLHEITIIATEPTTVPADVANEIGGKAVELRSYIEPTKGKMMVVPLFIDKITTISFFIIENDSALHTQLWIDPTEEFVQFTHVGDPVDITFGVKELKAFLSFCEGCELDIHLYFDKAGEPILMAPKFGLDDGSVSNFDSTLVLATMLTSQLHEGSPSVPPPATVQSRSSRGTGSQLQERERGNVSEHPSDHTRIWSDLSGSARGGNGAEQTHVENERNVNDNEQMDIQRISTMHISKAGPAVVNGAPSPSHNHPVEAYHPMETEHAQETQGRQEIGGHGMSQRHPSNWVDADDDEDEDDETEICVQATPPYHEE